MPCKARTSRKSARQAKIDSSKMKLKRKRLPNKTDVNTEAAMNCRTINTQKDPIRHRCPRRILSIAIKTHLTKKIQNSNYILTDLKSDLKFLNLIKNKKIKK